MQNGKQKNFESHQIPLQNRVNKWWTRAEKVVGRETCRTMEERKNKEGEKEE